MKCWQKYSTVKNRPSYTKVLVSCLAAFLLAALASLLLGSTGLTPKELLDALLGTGDERVRRILLYVRLPRTVAAILAGGALAASGVIIQSVMGNPLAGPNLIGVNAGAGLAVVLCTAFLSHSVWIISTAAFLGALGAMLLIYSVARITGASRITLVLAGIAISNILSACIDTVVTLIPDALTGISAFRIGSLSGLSMNQLYLPGIYILIALSLAFGLRSEMDVLALGEETALSLGMNTKIYRFFLLLTAAMLAGAAVSFCGLLGFVGLIVPHAARFLAGSESKRLLPVSLLFGSAFVLVCDILARILFAPFELPVGVIMSFLGGPFFLWLLIRKKGGHTGND